MRYPCQIDGHPGARAGLLQLLAMHLQAADACAQAGRCNLDFVAHLHVAGLERPGHHRTKAVHAEHPIDPQTGWFIQPGRRGQRVDQGVEGGTERIHPIARFGRHNHQWRVSKA